MTTSNPGIGCALVMAVIFIAALLFAIYTALLRGLPWFFLIMAIYFFILSVVLIVVSLRETTRVRRN